jgi:uncharacterized protein (DUF1697 family)
MDSKEHNVHDLLGNDRDQRTRAFMVQSYRQGQDERLARRALLEAARVGDERALSKLELDQAADSRNARTLAASLVRVLARHEPIDGRTFAELREVMHLAGKWDEADRSIARQVERVEHAVQDYLAAMRDTGALLPLTPHQVDELSFDAVDVRSTREWDDVALAEEALHEQRLDERHAALEARRDYDALWLDTVRELRAAGNQNERVDPLAVEWREPSPVSASYPNTPRATLNGDARRGAIPAPRTHKVRPTGTDLTNER